MTTESSGGGFGGGGFGSSGRGPGGPRRISKGMPRSAADWFEALATGRPNPFGSSTVGAVQYSIHEEMFRHARGRGETDLRTWSRNVFRNLGMTVDNEGTRFSGRFIPHLWPGARRNGPNRSIFPDATIPRAAPRRPRTPR